MVTSLKDLSTVMVGTAFVTLGTLVATPSYATTLTGFQTSGNDMAGMQVTANFLGGGSQTANWNATGSDSGGAVGNDWSLTESGDTFDSPWTFSNSGQSISSLTINAIPGNTVFDTDFGGKEGTPGSASGRTFTVQSGSAPASFAYSVPIDISAGDLFGTLSLNYNNGFKGTMTYLADTDSGTSTNPVKPASQHSSVPVPEPSSVLPTLAFSALGAGRMLRRRQKQNIRA